MGTFAQIADLDWMLPPEILLVTAGLVAGGVMVIVIGNWVIDRLYRQPVRRHPHGFEVKMNAGGEPVLTKERDNDHG